MEDIPAIYNCQNIDFHFYNSPDSSNSHSHYVFHDHVKKYHLYYSFPAYAAGFTYIFCHLPSVHWYFVKSKVIYMKVYMGGMVIYLESGKSMIKQWLKNGTSQWYFVKIKVIYMKVYMGGMVIYLESGKSMIKKWHVKAPTKAQFPKRHE